MDEWRIKVLKEQGLWEQKKWISAPGLCEIVKKTFGTGGLITGLEIGVASGWTMNHFLNEIPNLILIGVDPYVAYDDGGIQITQEKLDAQFAAAQENISEFDRATIVKEYSDKVASFVEEDLLDYIFIDGDHSYDGVLKDLENFYSKVKTGGIFAGHDYSLKGVRDALDEFRKNKDLDPIKHTNHDVWYWIK